MELYNDSLEAWRKNPIAWRIIAITTDYVIGDRIAITSPKRDLARFIAAFWNHPQNRLDLRLEAMSDELARSGDLFVALFRNPTGWHELHPVCDQRQDTTNRDRPP